MMSLMGEKYTKQLDELSGLLNNPDKIGRVAMDELFTGTEQMAMFSYGEDLPVTHMLAGAVRGPLPLSTEHTLERLDRLGKLA